MVLLTIVAPSNPHTVYLDHDIAKPNYIRLLSASMYNSWYNLAENGIMSVQTGLRWKQSQFRWRQPHLCEYYIWFLYSRNHGKTNNQYF